MPPPKYQLEVRVELRPCNPDGFPQYGPGNLQVQETLTVEAASFLEIAQILGQFHELAEKLREQKHAG